MPQTDAPVRVLSNREISAAGTADTDAIYVRGARSVQFIVTGSDTTNLFAASNALQLLVQPHENVAMPTAVSTPSQFGLEIVDVANLNGATASAGRIVLVRPTDGKAAGMGPYQIKARLTAAGATITDVDVYAQVIF